MCYGTIIFKGIVLSFSFSVFLCLSASLALSFSVVSVALSFSVLLVSAGEVGGVLLNLHHRAAGSCEVCGLSEE